MTPVERELIDTLEGGHNYRHFSVTGQNLLRKVLLVARRLDAESRRQRRVIASLKKRIKLFL